MKLRAFLFDSAYQVVTWVLIALSISASFFFLSNRNYRAAGLSGVALLVFVVIMLWLLYDRYRTESKTGDVPIPPSNRPWLNVEVIPGGPITYRPQQSGISAFFPITFRITNAGRSPSSEIQLKADVFFARCDESPLKRQRKIADSKGNPFRPGVVFPSRPEEQMITWVKPTSKMIEAGAHPSYPPGYVIKHFTAYIGGCITYPCGGDPIFYGETGFLYEMQVHDVTNRATTIVPEIGKDIPVERLTFRRYFPGGGEWVK